MENIYQALKNQITLEISVMREILAIEHQAEYSLLSGDTQLQRQLDNQLHACQQKLFERRQKRQELTAKIMNISSHGTLDLSALLASTDNGYETSMLYEQLELLEIKIDSQSARNGALARVINTKLPLEPMSKDDTMSIQPVYSKYKQRPIMLTVDYDEDPTENQE